MSMSSFNTQPVITSGIQTNRPAIRYLRTRLLFADYFAGVADAGAGALAVGVAVGAAAGVGATLSDFTSDFVSGLASVLLSAPPSGVAVSVFASAAGFLPSRKSVTYQPLPFNWKPGAVNCLANVAAPQAGQTVNGSALIFCKTSLVCPQDEHL